MDKHTWEVNTETILVNTQNELIDVRRRTVAMIRQWRIIIPITLGIAFAVGIVSGILLERYQPRWPSCPPGQVGFYPWCGPSDEGVPVREK